MLVISTIDFPSEWDVAGVADTPEAALAGLRAYWHEASKQHPSNPDYVDWRLEPQKPEHQKDFPYPDISAIDPRTGEKARWSLREYEVWHG